MRGHERLDGKLEDLCDGTSHKTHPLFSKDKTALQILMYYDDLEVVNPIGSKATKHKLGEYCSIMYSYSYIIFTKGVFYFLLGNIPPRHRSSLNAIQVFTVVKQCYITQYGIDKVLESFMDDIAALESVSSTSMPFIVISKTSFVG